MKKGPIIIGFLMAVFLGILLLFRIIIMTQDSYEVRPLFVNGSVPANKAGTGDSKQLKNVSVNNVDVSKTQGAQNPEKLSTLKMDANLSEEDWQNRINAGLSDREIHAVYNKCTDLFAFHSMKEEEKQLYAEIYLILTNHATDVFICSLDESSIDYAYNCVLNDHPEIFYIDGYNYTRYSAGEIVQKISLSGQEILKSDEMKRYEKDIMNYEKEFLSGISTSASDYEKVKYTYEYIIRETDYDEKAPLNQTICSVMTHHRSVCQGYAKTFQYLLDKLGVRSTLIVGRTKKGENHSWNLVNVDGAYYYVDTTWGDNSYQVAEGGTSNVGGINYDYLCITTDELLKSRVVDNVVPVPACISNEANYFIKEGLYFEGMDEEKLSNAFRNEEASENGFVSIKCSSDQVFESMFQTLIVNQDIFRFVPGGADSLNYTYNEDMNTLTVFFR